MFNVFFVQNFLFLLTSEEGAISKSFDWWFQVGFSHFYQALLDEIHRSTDSSFPHDHIYKMLKLTYFLHVHVGTLQSY